MTETIIGLVLMLAGIFFVRSYCRKLAYRRCGADGDLEERVKPEDMRDSHYPYVYTAEVDGMNCENCGIRLENTFHRRTGYFVRSDYREGTLLVRSKTPVRTEHLSRIVSAAGCTLTAVHEAESAEKEDF